MAISKHGAPITTLAEWKDKAGPKRADQWKPGRSALEVARAWLAAGDQVPEEVLLAFRRNPLFGEVKDWQAEPEAPLDFDELGEERNTDLLLEGTNDKGRFLVAVEAKADEPFGNKYVSAQLADALDKQLTNPRSNEFRRIQQLACAILGPRRDDDTALKKIRYQLLTATAGAMCEAARKRIATAILLIHEFVTDKTDDKKHRVNQRDLDGFIRRVTHGTHRTLPCGEIVGPIQLPGQPLFSNEIGFFVLKVSRNLRTT